MKNIIVLFLLFPFVMSAKMYPGKITFNDGVVKSGYIDIPDFRDQKVKFKATEDSKAEKFEIDLVKGFEFQNEKNSTIKYVTLYLSMPKSFKNDELKIDKHKTWLRIEKEGNAMDLVSVYYYSTGGGGGIGQTAGSSGTVFYLWKKAEAHCLYLYESPGGGFAFVLGAYKAIYKCVEHYFATECPKLVESMDKEDIKKNGLGRIIELYDANCGTK